MASARAWPRHAAARNVVRLWSGPQWSGPEWSGPQWIGPQWIVEVRTETGPIEATAQPAPRKTQPAVPSSVRAGTETKTRIAPPVRNGVRVMKRTALLSGPAVGTKADEINRAASRWGVSLPVGAARKKSGPRARTGEVATTDPHATTETVGMTVPRARNPRVGGVRTRR